MRKLGLAAAGAVTIGIGGFLEFNATKAYIPALADIPKTAIVAIIVVGIAALVLGIACLTKTQ